MDPSNLYHHALTNPNLKCSTPRSCLTGQWQQCATGSRISSPCVDPRALAGLSRYEWIWLDGQVIWNWFTTWLGDQEWVLTDRPKDQRPACRREERLSCCLHFRLHQTGSGQGTPASNCDLLCSFVTKHKSMRKNVDVCAVW